MKITVKSTPKIRFEETYGGDIIQYLDELFMVLSMDVVDKDTTQYEYNAVNLVNGDLELIPYDELVYKVVESELIVKL